MFLGNIPTHFDHHSRDRTLAHSRIYADRSPSYHPHMYTSPLLAHVLPCLRGVQCTSARLNSTCKHPPHFPHTPPASPPAHTRTHACTRHHQRLRGWKQI